MAKTSKLNWGILATGRIAGAFAYGVKHSKTGKLVAVGSRTPEGAESFGKTWGIPKAKRHGSYEALLADKDVDAVYIATPHPGHAEWAIKAAEAGKHVLCEKPMGMNAAEAMAMFEAAHKNGVFMMEAFMYRCHPQIAEVVKLVRNGAIGEVRMIQSTFGFGVPRNDQTEAGRILANNLGGGGILDVGCYPVSLARLIAGTAIGKNFDDPIEVKGSGELNKKTGTDEWAAATLKFASGIVAQVSTSVLVNQDNSTRIYGSDGWLHLPEAWIPSREAEPTYFVLHKNGKAKKINVTPDVPLYSLEADAVADAIHKNDQQATPPAMTWDDTLGNLRTMDAWRSAIGLVYDLEKPDAPEMKTTVANRKLKSPTQPSPVRRGRARAAREGGGMKYGNIIGVNKPVSRVVMGVDNQPTIAFASVMFDDFFERGGNTFDTAHIYSGGNSERLLGQWVRNRGVRDQVVLICKGAHTPFCDPASLTKQFNISMERMGLDYADIYMMHRDNEQIPVDEFVDAMHEQAAAGRVKVFGGSNWSFARVQAANDYAKKNGKQAFSVVSNNFSLARMVEPPWAGCVAASDPAYKKWLNDNQMTLMPWSSQARGFFLDDTSPDFTADPERVRCWFSEDNFERLKRARELAKKYEVLPINIALAYVLNQKFPTFPLIGPRSLTETRTSLPGLHVALTDAEASWLNLES
jgi:predicted dehydrogenase/aryl-alcohol dehydrogenase-like predicted oxidoreductase